MKNGSVSRVTKECWQLLDETPTPMFMRYNQTAQVQPNRDYGPDIFDRFLHLTNLKKEEDRILTKSLHRIIVHSKHSTCDTAGPW